jgi:hypothetical protein
MSSFPPTFKDTNKKESVYVMIKLGLVKRKIDRPRVRVADPRQRRQKKGLVDDANRAQVHRKPTGDLVPFSPRRVLPRFVNPRIGSKLLRLSI